MSAHDLDLQRRIQLERADAAKKALEEGIQSIQNYSGNETYLRAMKIAVRMLREVKAKF